VDVARTRRGFVVGAASGVGVMSPGSVDCSTAARLTLRRFGVGVVAPVGSAASVAVVAATGSFAAAASWRRVRRRVGVVVSWSSGTKASWAVEQASTQGWIVFRHHHTDLSEHL